MTLHSKSAEESDICNSLLSSAADIGSDLLVMGCYGHSRAREWVMGGVTRSMLQTMTIPVLMTH
ncbi:universal stress protein [Comamonas odontotermitis]|uniref:universal stress protein n=1 Tax=Comamonas odontotermitis TaxID=379895 RepID=UPI002D80615E|nr:universal stress protein [Comamonas odontotermitis]